MEKIDARKLSTETQQEIRYQVVRLKNQGQVRFMVYDSKMNSQTLIKFMGRLIKDSEKKSF